MRYLADRGKTLHNGEALPIVENITGQKLIEKGMAGAVNAEIE